MTKARLHRIEGNTVILIIDKPGEKFDLCVFLKKGEKVEVSDEHGPHPKVSISSEAEESDLVGVDPLYKKDVVTLVDIPDEFMEKITERAAKNNRVVLQRP